MKPTRKVVGLSKYRLDAYIDPGEGQPTQSVQLGDLNRQELISAAKIQFPQIAGNRWFKCSRDELYNAILSDQAPTIVTEPSTEPATAKQLWKIKSLGLNGYPGITKEDASLLISNALGEDAPIEIEEEPQVPAVTTKTAETSIDAQFSELVRAIAGKQQAQLDPAQVRTIAAEVVQEAVAALQPKVTRIEIAGREPIELEGKQHAVFPDVVRILGLGLHVYLVGPPGTGKSTLAHQAADALGRPFGAISLDPTLPPSRLFGYQDANGVYVRTVFRDIYEHGGVFLFDEIDNGHPGVLASINQSLSNGYCAFPDGMIPRHKDTVVVASANTHGLGPDRQFVGRNQLDAATLDRFTEVEVAIDEELEEALTLAESPSKGQQWLTIVRQYRANVQRAKLPVVISPRASIEGARLIEAGFPIEQVKRLRIEKGLSTDVLAKIR